MQGWRSDEPPRPGYVSSAAFLFRFFAMAATASSTGATVSPAAVAPYAITIFLSAFLLFLVQPIIARQILPWFGGASSVWTTCLVFFQSALLAGYAYADVTMRLGARRQALLHATLLLISLATLPILAADSWKPQGDEAPIARILLLLVVTIGLPYFLLSTTTPLLQSWYWRRFRSVVPYRLFALSNFASLLALLGFPVLFEPWFDLRRLGQAWSALYVAFVALCVYTAWRSLQASREGEPRDAAAPDRRAAGTAPPSAAMQALWLALSAMGSVMLLAVTNHVTQNVASVPFLWVVPLSLYLLTFILCFDHPRWYVRPLFFGAALLLVPAMAWQIASLNLHAAVPLYFAGLFVACMVCHGELARAKPAPEHLTRFYLMLSLGGAAGAVLVALVAPNVLRGYFELNIVLVLLALLIATQLAGMGRWIGLAAAALTAYLAINAAVDYGAGKRVMERDFYGVVRTQDRSVGGVRYRAMLHGAIMHGGQLLDEQYRGQPADYFGPTSGYGRLFAALEDLRPGPRKVGIIGLGAGVVAAYGRAGDTMTFYEISPKVIEIERREFSFLRDSPAKIEVIVGDGRLSLERELKRPGPRGYDVLGIDAFSGDSVPMHLVTREAMALYVRHLAPDGVIVFQATNRYIELAPVIKRLAAEQDMEAVLISDWPDGSDGVGYWMSATDQVLVTRNAKLLQHPRVLEASQRIEERFDLPTFTDARHNLLRILK
jgi:SAM-dependent methyltransferase